MAQQYRGHSSWCIRWARYCRPWWLPRAHEEARWPWQHRRCYYCSTDVGSEATSASRQALYRTTFVSLRKYGDEWIRTWHSRLWPNNYLLLTCFSRWIFCRLLFLKLFWLWFLGTWTLLNFWARILKFPIYGLLSSLFFSYFFIILSFFFRIVHFRRL